MKKYILKTVLSAFLVNVCIATISGQTQVTRYTPNGDPVRAYNQIPEMDLADKQDWSLQVKTFYPAATELNKPSATTSYNCHAYAWHVTEGGDNVWIGYYPWQKADEDIYWTGGSYINQVTETGAEKISYYEDNHSAVQTSTQGIYKSKWGKGPLMRHARDYGPSEYNMNYRRYYARLYASLVVIDNLTGETVNPMQMCPNTMYVLYCENNYSCSNYTWTLPYGMSLISTSQNWALINTNSSYGGIIMVHGQTCCTGSNVLLLTETLQTGGYNCGGYYYSYSPNPVSDELTVAAISTADEDKKIVDSSIKIEFEIKIYDSNKVVVRSDKSKGNTIRVVTTGLKKGVYFLHIIERERVIMKEQILVD